ncbi:MAG: MFS transporter, partial [Veillonella sp.]|nr:MFS transporter [Veillonella sp.]
LLAMVLALVTFALLRDTPQSCGLPPIEEWKNDYPDSSQATNEKMTFKEVFTKYILKNKFLWYLAIANIFVYFIRYGVVSWAPTYLAAVKGFTKEGARWAYFLYEWAGIPGMLVAGYLSDKVFRGRRAPATMIFMALVVIAILVYWFNPAGNMWVDNIALVAIGFLIYGPVMMIGLQAADMVPRVATGGATGLTGLLGYLIGSAGAGAFMGLMVDLYGWDGGFISLVAACGLAIVFLFLTLGDKTQQAK